MCHPRPLFHLFLVFFTQTIQFLQQINVKKCHVHPVYAAGFRTQKFLNNTPGARAQTYFNFFIKLIYNSCIEITFRLENDFWQSLIRIFFHWPSRTTSIPGAISALLWRQTRTLRCLQSAKLFNQPWEKLQSSASRPKPAAWRLSRLVLRLGDRLPMKEYKASRIRFVHNL